MNSLDSTSKKTNMRYGMLSLVFINVVINYLDRSNLSVAASGLGSELKLSSVELGYNFFCFWLVVRCIANPGRVGGRPDHPPNTIRSLPDHLVFGNNSPGVCQVALPAYSVSGWRRELLKRLPIRSTTGLLRAGFRTMKEHQPLRYLFQGSL